MSNKKIQKTVQINATAANLWTLLTEPVFIKQWLAEEEIDVTSEGKVGGALIFHGDLHGIDYESRGTILESEPGKVFRYTYQSNLSKTAGIPADDAVIEFKLEPKDQQTELILTCSHIATESIYGHLNFYWTVTLGLIKKLAEEQ